MRAQRLRYARIAVARQVGEPRVLAQRRNTACANALMGGGKF
jgi:hypothetical protein